MAPLPSGSTTIEVVMLRESISVEFALAKLKKREHFSVNQHRTNWNLKRLLLQNYPLRTNLSLTCGAKPPSTMYQTRNPS